MELLLLMRLPLSLWLMTLVNIVVVNVFVDVVVFATTHVIVDDTVVVFRVVAVVVYACCLLLFIALLRAF